MANDTEISRLLDLLQPWLVAEAAFMRKLQTVCWRWAGKRNRAFQLLQRVLVNDPLLDLDIVMATAPLMDAIRGMQESRRPIEAALRVARPNAPSGYATDVEVISFFGREVRNMPLRHRNILLRNAIQVANIGQGGQDSTFYYQADFDELKGEINRHRWQAHFNAIQQQERKAILSESITTDEFINIVGFSSVHAAYPWIRADQVGAKQSGFFRSRKRYYLPKSDIPRAVAWYRTIWGLRDDWISRKEAINLSGVADSKFHESIRPTLKVVHEHHRVHFYDRHAVEVAIEKYWIKRNAHKQRKTPLSACDMKRIAAEHRPSFTVQHIPLDPAVPLGDALRECGLSRRQFEKSVYEGRRKTLPMLEHFKGYDGFIYCHRSAIDRFVHHSAVQAEADRQLDERCAYWRKQFVEAAE